MSFVAISKVKYPPSRKEKVHNVGLGMIPIVKKQPGFISISFHQSLETNETMMYWEWESQAHHVACMESTGWINFMAESSALFQSEGIEFSIQTFERLA